MENRVIKIIYTDNTEYDILVEVNFYKNNKQIFKSIKSFINKLSTTKSNHNLIKLNDYFPNVDELDIYISKHNIKIVKVILYSEWVKLKLAQDIENEKNQK